MTTLAAVKKTITKLTRRQENISSDVAKLESEITERREGFSKAVLDGGDPYKLQAEIKSLEEKREVLLVPASAADATLAGVGEEQM